MEEQKKRSRNAATVDTEDWVELKAVKNTEFVGYDTLAAMPQYLNTGKLKQRIKNSSSLFLIKHPSMLNRADRWAIRGYIEANGEKISIEDTKKENNLTIHITKKLPKDINAILHAVVDRNKRLHTENNHSATHLLHSALKKVLGTHVEQKGSLVDDEHLRFDFSHFAKMTGEEIAKVEALVNEKILENIIIEDLRNIPIAEAQKMGATALFGEKYGDHVRVVAFDRKYSIELCGGTHVHATGQIGIFKILSESACCCRYPKDRSHYRVESKTIL